MYHLHFFSTAVSILPNRSVTDQSSQIHALYNMAAGANEAQSCCSICRVILSCDLHFVYIFLMFLGYHRFCMVTLTSCLPWRSKHCCCLKKPWLRFHCIVTFCPCFTSTVISNLLGVCIPLIEILWFLCSVNTRCSLIFRCSDHGVIIARLGFLAFAGKRKKN